MSFAHDDNRYFRVYLQFLTCLCIEHCIVSGKVLLQGVLTLDRLKLRLANVLKLSFGYSIYAQRISFWFLPLQSYKKTRTTEVYQSLRSLCVPCILHFFTIAHV